MLHWIAPGVEHKRLEPWHTGGWPASNRIEKLQTDQQFPTLGSQTKGFEQNADGSNDIYFAPTAPEGQEGNWLQTVPGGIAGNAGKGAAAGAVGSLLFGEMRHNR